MGDGVAAYGVLPPGVEDLLVRLRSTGFDARVKPMPVDYEGCMEFLCRRRGLTGLTRMTAEEQRAVVAAVELYAWFYRPKCVGDAPRGGTPHLTAAQAIAPGLPFHVNATGKTVMVEYWDEEARIARQMLPCWSACNLLVRLSVLLGVLEVGRLGDLGGVIEVEDLVVVVVVDDEGVAGTLASSVFRWYVE